MLITEKVKVKWNTSNKKILIENGYNFTKMGYEIEVDISCLTKGSHTIVECTCDDCGEKVEIEYRHYLKNIEKYGKIYCSECSLEHAKDSIRRGKMSISMGQWAIDNNLFHHIDLEKTKAEGIDIFNISYKSGIEIWFKCLKKDYHGSYKAQCRSFVDNKRCPCCSGKEVHPLDSLAQSIINEYGLDFFNKVWNWEKNNELGINPWKITPSSNEKVWWNCLDDSNNHEPYLRSCYSSKQYKYRCPNCYEHPTGKDNPNYNPDLTDEDRKRRRYVKGYNKFIDNVKNRDDNMCQITGKCNCKLIVHHLNGYNWDKDNRTNPDNAITLCEEIHKLFHSIYGYKNCTKEQFEDFLEKIENGEIDISNIN